MKFSEQEIIKAVRCVLESNQSIKASAKAIGMSHGTLEEYVNKVREHGYSCLIRTGSNRHHTGDFKIYVVEYARKNALSNRATAAKFNLAKSVVAGWERIYLEEGPKALFEERRGRKSMGKKQRGRPLKIDKQVEEDFDC